MNRAAKLLDPLVAVLTLALPAFAHCGHRGGDCCDSNGNGGGCCHHMAQNRQTGLAAAVPAAEQSREGKVIEVIYLPGAASDTGMVEVRLMAGSQQVTARLAPSEYLHQNRMDLREGDTISVTGYWVAAGGHDMLIATHIAKGGQTVQLRDGWGRSAW